MPSIIVSFGDESVQNRKVQDYPADDTGFVGWVATSFDIPPDALGPRDRQAILGALQQLTRGIDSVRINLDYAPHKDVQPTFSNLLELLQHYLQKTKSTNFWINYSTWGDFLSKINAIFLNGAPPRGLKTLVIHDSAQMLRFDLSQGPIAKPQSSTPSLVDFLQTLRTERDAAFVLEDVDVSLETNDNYRGDDGYPLKSHLKNIVSTPILAENNSILIVAANASDEIRIPSQLRGFWITWRDASKDFPVLESLGENLTARAKAARFSEVLGRDADIESLITVLTKEKYNNVLITGRPGVGKTEVVRGLAMRIAEGQVPEQLKNVQIFDVLFANILKDMSVAGSLEARITTLRDEVEAHRKEVIVFFDEFHQLMANDTIRNVLKPSLANGEFPCVGATTDDEFRQFVAGADEAFVQRFFRLELDELPKPIINNILRQQILRKGRGNSIEDCDLDYLYSCCKKLMPFKALPRSGEIILANILNEIPENGRVTHEIVKNSFPIGRLVSKLSGAEGFESVKQRLCAMVRGQNEQIEAVLKALRNHFYLLTTIERPLVMLFMGPTGTGKSELAIQLCKHIWNDENRYVLINMGSVEQKTSITGAPPGYVGYEDSSAFLNFLTSHDSGIVILDEFEKVLHQKQVLDTLLEVFDKGTLSDNRGRKLNCRPFVFILTTNLAADSSGRMSLKDSTDILVQAGLRKEFIGRVKLIEVFNRVERETALAILIDAIGVYNERPDYYCRFKFEQGALDFILDRADFATYGVRHLQSTLAEVMNEILFQNSEIQFQNKTFRVGLSGGGLHVT